METPEGVPWVWLEHQPGVIAWLPACLHLCSVFLTFLRMFWLTDVSEALRFVSQLLWTRRCSAGLPSLSDTNQQER